MDDIRVASWAELNDRLYDESWDPAIGRFRSSFVFRGMPDAGYGLETTLMRLRGDYGAREDALLRTFRRYARQYAAPTDSTWNWLAIAQHHGLATRLLDWTYSPFVAMHFATANLDQFHLDGVIWCVNYQRTNRFLPDRFKQVLDQHGAQVFTAEMLIQVADTLDAFDAAARQEFVVFFEPPSLDGRIVNQFALFALMSSPIARLDHWLERHPDCVRRLIIPASLKWEVRDKLDQANITERVLMPGLDGLSSWLTRYYTARER